MQRLRDYARFLVWSSGLGYLALWAATFWTLDYGAALFAKSGSCRPDVARELFYWTCDPASPLAMLGALANTALAFTVWAPVYVAAAMVQPQLIVIAGPIVATHVIGLPAALLVTIRSLVGLLEALRWLVRGAAERLKAAPMTDSMPAPATPAQPPSKARARPLPSVQPRETFGLRGARGR
jgi:hypothetical protein